MRAAEWRACGPALAAALVPTGLVLLWLKPIVDETVSHDPGRAERLRAIQHYGSSLVVSSDRHYRLAAEMFGRSGAVAVAALFLLPLAGLAVRRRWGAFVLGGALLVLVADGGAVALRALLGCGVAVPVAPGGRVRAACRSRFAGAFALLTRRLLVLPVALLAGIVLQQLLAR